MKEIISICKGISCTLKGADKVHKDIEKAIVDKKINDIEIVESRCKGNCTFSPNVSLLKAKKIFNKVSKEKVEEIIKNIE